MDWLLQFRRRIRSGYVVSFLLLLFAFFLIFYVQQRLAKESGGLIHSFVILNKAETLKADLALAEGGMRGYLITREDRFLEPYNMAVKTVPDLCHELKELTRDNEGQQQLVDTLSVYVRDRMQILSDNLSGFQNAGYVVTQEFKMKLDSGMYAMNGAAIYLAKVKQAEEKIMEQRRESLAAFFKSAKWMAILALVVVSLALLYSIIKFNTEYRARRKADSVADTYRADLESSKSELEKKNVQLKELQDLEKFTSTGRIARTIAHEVRNPLTNILLATEQLKESEAKNEETPLLLDLINRNAARINQLVSDLLNATRFSQLDFHETDINQLMDETLVLAKDRIELNEIRLEKDYMPGKCHISVDKEKMKVALLNIIVNAIEAMEKGKGVLQLTTKSRNGKCIIEIRDNGKGFDDEVKAKLFEPYFTTKLKGNGLGLTNTQNIILNHNGTIRVQSSEGEGSCFSIALEQSETVVSQTDRKIT